MTADFVIKDKVVCLKGRLNFHSVPALLPLGERYLGSIAHGRIDLAQVAACDTSAVALFLGWVRYAYRLNKTVTFKNAPESVLAMLQVCGVLSIIPIEKEEVT